MLSFFKNLFFIQQRDTGSNFVEKLVLSESANFFIPLKIKQVKEDNAIYLTKPSAYLLGLSKVECFFLRKNRTFNKGRFSRNRQIYRTGVYFCFYINILTFYAL